MTQACSSCGATSADDLPFPTSPPAGAPSLPADAPADQVASASLLVRLFNAILAPLWALVHYNAPLKPAFVRNYAVSAGNLPQGTGADGAKNTLKLTPLIPAGCRGFLLRNLSASAIVTYWYEDSPSPTNNTDFNTLPASSAIAQDVAPTSPTSGKPALTLLAAVATDAQVEVTFYV